MVVDTFMGQVLVDAPLPAGGSNQVVKVEKELFGKGSKSETLMSGKIMFEYRTTSSMSEL